MKLFISVSLPSDHPFLVNKYTRWYYAIIEAARQRQPDSYTEKHHIIPVCFYSTHNRSTTSPGWLPGNPDVPNNLVALTYREHFACHWLLTKMVTGVARIKMARALKVMCHGFTSKSVDKSSQVYARLRIARIIHLKNSESPRKNKKYGKQANPFKGKRVSANLGKKFSDEVRQRMSQAMKGRTSGRKGKFGIPSPKLGKSYGTQSNPAAKIQCPHCPKLISSNNLNRHLLKCSPNNITSLKCQ